MATSTKLWCSRNSKSLCFLALVTTCCIVNLVQSHGHAHDHGHAHGDADEAPSFKYSRQANVQHEQEDRGSSQHGHAHEHHGHAHEHHGHAHEHHGHAHDHGQANDHHAHKDNKKDAAEYWEEKPKANKRGSTSTLWAKAIGATALISVAPVFILVLIPLENADEHQQLLKVLLSFASGGLLGDAFLHLIPHAISPHSHGEDDGHQHSHSHSHDHGHSHEAHSHDMRVGLWVLGGIIAFLMVEKFVRYIKGDSGHGHSHGPPKKSPKNVEQSSPAKAKPKDKKAKTSDNEEEASSSTKKEKASPKAKDKKDKGDKPDEAEETNKEEAEVDVVSTHGSDIKVAGYLNLAADFAHNFTDGLAIGASFLAGQNVGIITTITIFLHEIPHEIGDFAILIQSGCSKRKAMMLQFSTAIGAMLGTLSSLVMEGIGEAATAWILPFTAGGFIYIATVSVIPELLEDSKIGQSIKEILALLLGVYMMVLIAEYE